MAAQLVAEDRLSDDEIAARASVVRRQLERWKLVPQFKARVQEHVAEFRAKAGGGLADRYNQVAHIKARLAEIDGIIEARGKTTEPVPPGSTPTQRGLQVHTVKSIGSGDKQQVVHEFAIDTEVIAEERALLQHLAILMGFWKQQVEHSGKIATETSDEAKLLAELFSPEEIERAIERAKAK